MTEEEQLFARSLGLKHAVQTLTSELERVSKARKAGRITEDAFSNQGCGCVAAAAILLPFATELALKAILKKKCGKFAPTHDLAKLYKSLGPETQKIVDLFYGTEQEPSIEEILEKHKCSFIEWRYPRGGKLHMAVEDLSRVLCKLHTAYKHM